MAAARVGRTEQISRAISLHGACSEDICCRGALGTRVNLYTIGYVWTGELDLNTLRVDGEIFESGKKQLRIIKYPDTCERGLIGQNSEENKGEVIRYLNACMKFPK